MRKGVKTPGAFIRLLAPRQTARAESPDTSVIVSKTVGDGVLRIAARFSDGRSPLEICFDRRLFSDEETDRLVEWVRRVARRKDAAGALKVI